MRCTPVTWHGASSNGRTAVKAAPRLVSSPPRTSRPTPRRPTTRCAPPTATRPCAAWGRPAPAGSPWPAHWAFSGTPTWSSTHPRMQVPTASSPILRPSTSSVKRNDSPTPTVTPMSLTRRSRHCRVRTVRARTRCSTPATWKDATTRSTPTRPWARLNPASCPPLSPKAQISPRTAPATSVWSTVTVTRHR